MIIALRNADLPIDQVVSYWAADQISKALSVLDEEKLEEPEKPAAPTPKIPKAKILQALKDLYDQGIMYNAPAATRGSEQITKAVSKVLGFQVEAKFLYDEAGRQFGNFRKALLAADLPADEIILYRNRDIDLLATEQTQVERIVEDGEVRYQLLLGEAPQTPEELLAKSETETKLIDLLPANLRNTGKIVLDLILSLNGEDIEPAEIFKELAEKGVDTTKAQKVFQYLKGNEAVREILIGE